MPCMYITQTRFPFTERRIRALPPHDRSSAGSQKEFSDAECVGLRVSITKGGRKFWMYRYTWRGRKHLRWIGEVTQLLNLKEARRRVCEMKLMLSRGENPAEWKNRQRAIPTLGEFVEETYLPYCKASVGRPDVIVSRLNSGALTWFRNRPLDTITRAEVHQFHAAMRVRASATTANRHLMVVKRVFSLAVEWEIVLRNPTSGVKKFPEPSGRDRYLSRAELTRFLAALDGCPNVATASGLRLLLYTGLRSREVFGLMWRDVYPEQRSIHLRHTKAGNSRRVYLCSFAWAEIERMLEVRTDEHPYVFPGYHPRSPVMEPHRCFRHILKQAKIEDFKIHDIRHTHASYLVQSGATLFEVQKALGHTTPIMTQRYAHLCDRALRDRAEAAVNFFRPMGSPGQKATAAQK